MIRKFNYTERIRITREKFTIKVERNDKGEITKFAIEELYLTDLNLPNNAEVWIEVYNTSSELKQFHCGTLKELQLNKAIELTDFFDTFSVKFRILVVDPTDKKILAVADRIKPEVPEEKEAILPFKCDDLGSEIWKVEFTDDEGAPILVVNKNIPNIQNIAKIDPIFFMNVYPAVLRTILTHLVFIEGVDSVNSPSIIWHNNWLKFAKNFANLPSTPYQPENLERDLKEEWLNWIENVVSEFCAKKGKWKEYINKLENYE